MRTRLSTIVKWFMVTLVVSIYTILGILIILVGAFRPNIILVLGGFLAIVFSLPIGIITRDCISDNLSLPRFSISRMGIHRVRERSEESSASEMFSTGDLTVNSADSLFSAGDYHLGQAVANSQGATLNTWPLSWPSPSEPSTQESRRRRRLRRDPLDALLESLEQARQAERGASGRRRSLQHIPDRDYIALGQALHAEFNGRRRPIYEISERDQSERHRLTQIRWAEHRRENPECDCHRCRVYRGEVGEETEDPLGW